MCAAVDGHPIVGTVNATRTIVAINTRNMAVGTVGSSYVIDDMLPCSHEDLRHPRNRSWIRHCWSTLASRIPSAKWQKVGLAVVDSDLLRARFSTWTSCPTLRCRTPSRRYRCADRSGQVEVQLPEWHRHSVHYYRADDQKPDHHVDALGQMGCVLTLLPVNDDLGQELSGDVHVENGRYTDRAKEANEAGMSDVIHLVDQAEVVISQHHWQPSK